MGKIKATIGKAVKTVSGKAIEDKIEEYSEVYGEVLLGLHRDIERQNRFLQDYKQQLDNQIQQLRRICVLSYVFALGIGVAVWLIH